MPTSGELRVEELQQDLSCPDCGYNLRGLRGVTITCPECGATFDAARLLTQRWRGPWHTAPGYSRLALPLAWGIGALVAGGALYTRDCLYYSDLQPATLLLLAAVTLIGILGWFWLLHRTARWFGGPRALSLVLLVHAVYGAYVLGIMGLLQGLFTGLAMFTGPFGRMWDALQFVTAAFFALLFGAMVYAARRGERYLAQQCIRRHLLTAAAPTSTPA